MADLSFDGRRSKRFPRRTKRFGGEKNDGNYCREQIRGLLNPFQAAVPARFPGSASLSVPSGWRRFR